MMQILIGLIVFSLFITFCFRHFFVQLLGLKLFLDATIVFLICAKSGEVNAAGAQSAGALVSAISVLIFFVLMAAGIQRFARSRNSSLEVSGD